MNIQQVWALRNGSRSTGQVHVVSIDSIFKVKPTIEGDYWNYTRGIVTLVDWDCPSNWTSLVPPLKGCKATLVTLINGRKLLL